ncbi:hypothetical protein [Franconibacter helveticus]|uniref:hypothetical protein n=1 Tax=Franconibacter helveticus TaxID=357240 RepID=UPI00066A3A4B|nr:hypothetical protein [Franconibacter helveticus]
MRIHLFIIAIFFYTQNILAGETITSNGVKVELLVIQQNEIIIAKTEIVNDGKSDVYVYKPQLPILKKDKNSADVYYELCGSMFKIISNDIIVKYVGDRCHYGGNDNDSSYWSKIRPGEKLTSSVNLNDMYSFPAGRRNYVIGIRYDFVNDAWFTKKVKEEHKEGKTYLNREGNSNEFTVSSNHYKIEIDGDILKSRYEYIDRLLRK